MKMVCCCCSYKRNRGKCKLVLLTSSLCIITWIILYDQIDDTLNDGNKHGYLLGDAGGILDHQGNIDIAQDHHNKAMKSYVTVKPSDGENLAKRLNTKCSNYLSKLPKRHANFPVTTNLEYKIMFCPMCKLASTYWTRFFKLLEVYKKNSSISTPYDIPLKKAPPTKQRLTILTGDKNTNFESHYKFLFVRDPYARILSAYVDKLFAPNPFFWKSLCRKMINLFRNEGEYKAPCGSDLQFKEYIKSINTAHTRLYNRGTVDCHDETFTGACHPCEVQYDFVGKMENFSSDSTHIFKKLQLTRSIEALQNKGKQLADDDALNDTVTSPFLWKNEIKTCIPWHEALNRIWKKLQIRGVIGKQPLSLTADEAEHITQQEFLDLIKQTQKLTSYEERKKQRHDALIEIYSQVDQNDLEMLKKSFKDDFELFEYDISPSYIFNDRMKTVDYYGYLEL
ncbi:hypothetical protein ACF0H5_018032 [Mactra antiquata]